MVKLVPNEKVVEVVQFETVDPAPQGQMTITCNLGKSDDGTDALTGHDRLPPGMILMD